MDIKQLKASMKLAELRAKSNPSEDNLAILKAATEAYEFALDPEKKTADVETAGPFHEDAANRQPEPVVPKPAAAPKATAKPAVAKPAAPKVESAPVPTQPTQSEPSTPQSPEQQQLQEAVNPA